VSKTPPLTELRAFEAAARLLSFKRAAAELGVTPTAVSHQIRLLELHCGTPLFRRRPRPLALTRSGQALFPPVHEAFRSIAGALLAARGSGGHVRLRVTCTNAFAARWLLPRLPDWRAAHADAGLEIIGTDTVLDLMAGDADVAIRYARRPPPTFTAVELARDTFHVVASPALVASAQSPLPLAELARFPLLEIGWPEGDAEAPTWRLWQDEARRHHGDVPDMASLPSISFREESHAIEAAIAGQGLAICSDFLIRRELTNGSLVPVSEVTLPGYGFYVIYPPKHAKLASIEAFTEWAKSVLQHR